MSDFDHPATVLRVTIRVETPLGLTEHHVETTDPAGAAMALAKAYSAAHAALREPLVEPDHDEAWVAVPAPVASNGHAR